MSLDNTPRREHRGSGAAQPPTDTARHPAPDGSTPRSDDAHTPMEFLHHGDALHPAPSDVELGVAQHGSGSAEAVLEEERKKRSTWRKSLSPGGGAGRGDDFAYAMPPAWHSEIVQSRQICEGPLWCAAVSDGGVVACGGSDCLVTVAALGGGAGCPPDWRLPRDALLLGERKLGGHGGPVFDVAFGPSSGSEETLVSVSADATARLWRGSGTALSCAMVFSHGSGVCACAFLGPECFATGGYDRNVRLWHLPSQRATAWAHLNDCVTALGARPGGGASGPRALARLAVGTRGGQMFVYKSRDHAHLEFEEMVLGTMRSSAFVEAEQCGAAGVKSTVGAGGALEGLAQAPRPKKPSKSLKSKLAGAFFKSKKDKDAERRASEARAAAFLNMTAVPADEPDENTKVEDDEALDGASSDDDDGAGPALHGPTHAAVATLAGVEHRATTLAFYDAPESDLDPDGGVLLAAANHAPVKGYDALNPHKEPLFALRGGVRASLGCGAAPSACGRYAAGGSEDGKILVWRLDGSDDALPSELDASARNAKVAAITAARFAPPAVARAALAAAGGDDLAARYDAALSTAFVVAADYSGRLLVAQREPASQQPVDLDSVVVAAAAPRTPARPSLASSAPGTAVSVDEAPSA